MIGQLIGAALAGGVLRGCFGAERAIIWKGGGCFRDTGTVTAGQALLVETMSSFALLTLAFGLALDPRQQKLFGPLLGPLAVGCALGLVSFASAGLVEGYTGASMNPTRCFAFAVARHNFTGMNARMIMRMKCWLIYIVFIADQWIWWVGPFCGAILLGLCYQVAPPYHSSSSI